MMMEMMKMMTMMGGRVFVPASQFHLIFPTPVSVCVCNQTRMMMTMVIGDGCIVFSYFIIIIMLMMSVL